MSQWTQRENIYSRTAAGIELVVSLQDGVWFMHATGAFTVPGVRLEAHSAEQARQLAGDELRKRLQECLMGWVS